MLLPALHQFLKICCLYATVFASSAVVGLPPDSFISAVAGVSAAGGIPPVAGASAVAGVYPAILPSLVS
jgi:hypothetical protein